MMKSIFLRLFLSLLFIWVIIRGGIYLLPGDPAEYLAHESLVPMQVSQIRDSMGLNHTFTERIFSLPETKSLLNKVDSQTLIEPALKNTFILALLSFLISFFLTVLFLFLSFTSNRLKGIINASAVLMISLPLSVFGPLLILWLCVDIPIFPITKSPWLPSFALAIHLSAFWYRALYKKIEHFLPHSAVLGARSRGIAEFSVFFNYLFIPVLGSIASFLGTQLGSLLSGSVLVEVIFQWNGLGSLLLKSVRQRDYPLIEISLLITTLLTVVSQQTGDWVQKKINVRS